MRVLKEVEAISGGMEMMLVVLFLSGLLAASLL